MSSQMSARQWLARYDHYPPSAPLVQRCLDVVKACGADLAMVLGDDDIGPGRVGPLRIDAVDGEPFLQNGLDAGVYVVARAAQREFSASLGTASVLCRRKSH